MDFHPGIKITVSTNLPAFVGDENPGFLAWSVQIQEMVLQTGEPETG